MFYTSNFLFQNTIKIPQKYIYIFFFKGLTEPVVVLWKENDSLDYISTVIKLFVILYKNFDYYFF